MNLLLPHLLISVIWNSPSWSGIKTRSHIWFFLLPSTWHPNVSSPVCSTAKIYSKSISTSYHAAAASLLQTIMISFPGCCKILPMSLPALILCPQQANFLTAARVISKYKPDDINSLLKTFQRLLNIIRIKSDLVNSGLYILWPSNLNSYYFPHHWLLSSHTGLLSNTANSFLL